MEQQVPEEAGAQPGDEHDLMAGQRDLQAALARTVIGGLLASTLITLVLIPAVYVSSTRAVERVRAWVRERSGSRQPARA